MHLEIKEIFDKNEVDDLKRFMSRRENLNKWNSYLVYIFHIIQSAGILSTSISASTNDRRLVWFGIGLNMIAGIIQIFEKVNEGQLKRLLNDIKKIRDGSYVDESPVVDIDKDSVSNSSPHVVGISSGDHKNEVEEIKGEQNV